MARSWKPWPAGRGGVTATPVLLEIPGTICEGLDGPATAGVSMTRGAMPSGVTTERGGGEGRPA